MKKKAVRPKGKKPKPKGSKKGKAVRRKKKEPASDQVHKDLKPVKARKTRKVRDLARAVPVQPKKQERVPQKPPSAWEIFKEKFRYWNARLCRFQYKYKGYLCTRSDIRAIYLYAR